MISTTRSLPRSQRFNALPWLFFALLCGAWTLAAGDIPFADVFTEAWERVCGLTTSWNALLDERIPRFIVLFATGAALATSGAIMQALFQNPLAAPSILGISSGGTLSMLLVSLTPWALTSPFLLPLTGFAGSLASLLFVVLLARRNPSPQALILTGIGLSTLFIAIQGAILFAIRDQWAFVQRFTEWEAGSTFDRSWQHVHLQLPLTLVGLIAPLLYRRELNILSLGEEQAKSLGVDVAVVQWRLILSVALLIGGAVAGVGNIAFFGLLIPHLFRQLWGPNCERLIPLCLIGGGVTLVFFDNLLRALGITALSLAHLFGVLGGIFFLFLLSTNRRQAV